MSSQSSSKSSGDSSDKSAAKSEISTLKRKADRGPLKVSINETAEWIEDRNEKLSSSDDVEEWIEPIILIAKLFWMSGSYIYILIMIRIYYDK